MKERKGQYYYDLRFDDESIALLEKINAKLDAIIKKEGIDVETASLARAPHPKGQALKATISIANSKAIEQLDKELDRRM